MKIELFCDKKEKETRIDVHYPVLDLRTKKLIHYLNQYVIQLPCRKNNEEIQLPLENIFYMDSVDGRTFFYDDNSTYESSKSLTALEIDLAKTTFVRISKTCILNTLYLQSFRAYPNHRMLAELKNGEKLIVSRKYIPTLKEKIRSVYDE